MNEAQQLDTVIAMLKNDCFVSVGKLDVWKNCECITASLIENLKRIPTLDELECEISSCCLDNNTNPNTTASSILKDIQSAIIECRQINTIDNIEDDIVDKIYICTKCNSKNTELVFADVVYTDIVCYDCGEEFSIVNEVNSLIDF